MTYLRPVGRADLRAMDRVDQPSFDPGCCAFCQTSSGPFVDTGAESVDGRVYVCVHECVPKLMAAAGYDSLQAVNALYESVERLEGELDALQTQRLADLELLHESEELRRAIAYTLQRGVVIDQRNQTIGLRHAPAQKRVDVDKSLLPG
jgi:hypothetical protein